MILMSMGNYNCRTVFFILINKLWVRYNQINPRYIILSKSYTTVTSSGDGAPLPGASVIIKGTTTGTTTDFDGNYKLNSVTSDATLVISFIGFITIEVPVNGQSQIDVVLQEDAQQLDEVVLTGYSAERKIDLTGAVTVVDIAPIEGQSLSSGNAMQALQGRVGPRWVQDRSCEHGKNWPRTLHV